MRNKKLNTQYLSLFLAIGLALRLLLSSLPTHGQTGSPLHDSTERAVMQSVMISSAVALPAWFAADEVAMEAIRSKEGAFWDTYTDMANEMGNKYVLIPANAALWGIGKLAGYTHLQRTSLNAFKSIGTAALATELIKLSAGRARPHQERGAYYFNPVPWQQSAYKSFPSGHTSLAFAFITPYAEQYTPWLYLIPFSVAFSRVYKNVHWPSDVLMGGTLGFLAGYFFQHKNRHIHFSINGLVVRF